MKQKPEVSPKKNPLPEKNPFRQVSFWLYFLIAAFFFYLFFSNYATNAPEETSWNNFEAKILANDDVEKVTKQAYTMVAFYGLNDKIGNASYYDSTGQYEQSIHRPYSEATATMIDTEVRQLIERAYERSKNLIIKHSKELETLANLLLEKEVVVKDDLEKIFGKKATETSKQSKKNTAIDHENFTV